MEANSVDIANEWILQAQSVSVHELARFNNMQGFWSIFNNIDNILRRIPSLSEIHLYKSFMKSLWYDMPGGAWIIPVEHDLVADSFTEVAMAMVGEIFNGSEHMYGIVLHWNDDNRHNEIWVWNYTDPPTSNDFVLRIRSILHLDERQPIHFLSHSQFDYGSAGVESNQNWPANNVRLDIKQNEIEPPEFSAELAVLSYERRFMKRFALFENCQDLPRHIEQFDWSLLSSPAPSVAGSPDVVDTISTWLDSSVITKWMALAQPALAMLPDDNDDNSIGQSNDIEYIRVAEACLDESSRTSPSNIYTHSEKLLQILIEEGCPGCLLTQEFVALVGFRCIDRHCLHAVHQSCSAALPRLEMSTHAPHNFDVLPNVILTDLSLGQVTNKICIVHVELLHLVGQCIAASIDTNASGRLDRKTGKVYIYVALRIASKIISFALTRARIVFICRMISSGEHWMYDAEFDISDLLDISCLMLTSNDPSTGIDLDVGIIRIYGGYQISAIRFSFNRRHPSLCYRSGGQLSPLSSVLDGPVSVLGSPLRWMGLSHASRYNISDIAKGIYQRARMQDTSRILPDELTMLPPEIFQLAFDVLLPRVADLMMDNFGHYTAETLAIVANEEQTLRLLHTLDPRVVQVACHKLGSFSLQAIMETFHSTIQINTVVNILRPHLKQITTSPSGHYVLLRALDLFDHSDLNLIFKSAAENTVEFSTDYYGLRVMKVIVASKPSESVNRVLYALASNTLFLVENQYGNYIIQLMLSLETIPTEIIDMIYARMTGRFAKMSKQKFSSNVVEQCIRRGTREIQAQVIEELLLAVNLLIKDRFGNYVLQTALECATRSQSIQLGTAIVKNLHLLRVNVRSKWSTIVRGRLGDAADHILNSSIR